MNKYLCYYLGKHGRTDSPLEVEAETAYEAQQIAAKQLKAKHTYQVQPMLVEVDGKPYTHSTSEI